MIKNPVEQWQNIPHRALIATCTSAEIGRPSDGIDNLRMRISGRALFRGC